MDEQRLPVNLHDFEAAARAVLPPMAYEYMAGGSGDEETLRGNREAFGRWRLVPRMMRGIAAVDPRTTVLGQEVSLPVLLAPVGLQRLAHPEGERASTRAARAAGTIFTLSTASTCAIEDVAPDAGSWWFQLYVYRDRGITRDLVERAAASGASALVLTVDVPVLGRREADERNRFTLPAGLALANLQRSDHRYLPADMDGSGLAAYITSIWESALSWKDLEWLASLTKLPVLAKGILAPEDACRALEHGARAIVVSNHGGRQLDSAVASLDALPAVVEAVDGRAEVLVDGGVRRGTDVIKALALGARAVLLGRPYLWGLAVDGEAGVRRVLELLRGELTRDLLLCGCSGPAEIDRGLITLGVDERDRSTGRRGR
jgi:4-hydroxymandelate oxidase